MFTDKELESIKMHIVHSKTGWVLKGGHTHLEQPNDSTLKLLKRVDFLLGEPNVMDEDYGYWR